jgi:predicted oxidoreductase
MRTIKLGNSMLEAPVIAVGCMRISSLDKAGAERFIRTALEEGANFFDHADVYGGGACEEIFAEAIRMNDDIRKRSSCNPSVASGRACLTFPGSIF